MVEAELTQGFATERDYLVIEWAFHAFCICLNLKRKKRIAL